MAMLYGNVIPKSPAPARLVNFAGCRRLDWRAGISRKIHPGMKFMATSKGIVSQAITGTDFQRAFQRWAKGARGLTFKCCFQLGQKRIHTFIERLNAILHHCSGICLAYRYGKTTHRRTLILLSRKTLLGAMYQTMNLDRESLDTLLQIDEALAHVFALFREHGVTGF